MLPTQSLETVAMAQPTSNTPTAPQLGRTEANRRPLLRREESRVLGREREREKLPQHNNMQLLLITVCAVAAGLLALPAASASLDIFSLPVTDTHVHLVDPTQGFQYSWQSGPDTCHQDCAVCTGNASDCNVYRHWTVQDYEMTQVLNTSSIVFMEVSTASTVDHEYGIAEAKWIQHLSETTEPKIKGIVGRCPLKAGAAAEACLEQITKVPKVRGIRSDFVTINNGTEPDPTFAKGVALLAKYKLSYDILIGSPEVLVAAEKLIAANPDVTFIVDHLGGAKVSQPELFGFWSESITAIAAHPNAHIKISGGPQQFGGPDWTPQLVAPYIKHCLSAFGAGRYFYAGNWFWVNNYSNLGKWGFGLWEVIRTTLPDDEVLGLFVTNGAKVYRL
eukprot:m.138623 g.138623  ORF g.138623 m.138623 type:complete len:391 (-) comp17035_c0_seq4:1327-2499(-)